MAHMTRDRSACTACGEPLKWTLSAKTGKPMPLNPDPTPAGNVWLDDDGRGHVASQPPLGVTELYLSHFATCPRADNFRRKP